MMASTGWSTPSAVRMPDGVTASIAADATTGRLATGRMRRRSQRLPRVDQGGTSVTTRRGACAETMTRAGASTTAPMAGWIESGIGCGGVKRLAEEVVAPRDARQPGGLRRPVGGDDGMGLHHFAVRR